MGHFRCGEARLPVVPLRSLLPFEIFVELLGLFVALSRGTGIHGDLLPVRRTVEVNIVAAARRHGIELLHGSELNIAADGSPDWDDEFLAGFDVLVASVHSDFDQTREEMTRRLLAAIEHPYINIIGHPTTRLLGRRPPVDFDADAVFAAAARTHTALEINAFPDRLDLSDELVSRAREYGVVFAIDTDAHAVPHLDNLPYGVAVAQRGWVSAGEVINSWPLDRLRGFLAKGRRLADKPSAAHHRAHARPH